MPLPGETAYLATNEPRASRLTTFFRFLIAIPHGIVLALWGIVVYFTLVISWFALLITGRYPKALYDFHAGFARFAARYLAYSVVAVSRFPPFDGGEHPEYPVELQIGPPKESYSRLLVLFRFVPLIVVYFILVFVGIFLYVVSFVSWFVILVLGRLPDGLHGAMAFCLSYSARSTAYYLLLTERFPGFDGSPADAAPTQPAGVSAY